MSTTFCYTNWEEHPTKRACVFPRSLPRSLPRRHRVGDGGLLHRHGGALQRRRYSLDSGHAAQKVGGAFACRLYSVLPRNFWPPGAPSFERSTPSLRSQPTRCSQLPARFAAAGLSRCGGGFHVDHQSSRPTRREPLSLGGPIGIAVKREALLHCALSTTHELTMIDAECGPILAGPFQTAK